MESTTHSWRDAPRETGDVQRTLPLARLVPAPGQNANKMREAEYAQLVENIKTVGFADPLLVRQLPPYGAPLEQSVFEIVDGHHRKSAAEDAGMKDVPCVVSVMSEERARLLRLSMNRLRGDVDLGIAAAELSALAEAGLTQGELRLAGFTDGEVGALLAAATEPADDAVLEQGFEPPEEGAAAPAPFLLEVEFETREALAAVKRKLKRAGGGSLAVGLMRVLEGA